MYVICLVFLQATFDESGKLLLLHVVNCLLTSTQILELSNFSHFCLLVKMASKTVTRSMIGAFFLLYNYMYF